MCADVARGHGGDCGGGGDPPHRHPIRIPTSCETCKLFFISMLLYSQNDIFY